MKITEKSITSEESIWSQAAKTNIIKLERMYNNAMTTITESLWYIRNKH